MARSSVLERLITDALDNRVTQNALLLSQFNSSVGQPDGIGSLDANGQQPAAEQTAMLADTIKGRLDTDGTPEDLTVAQVLGLLINDAGTTTGDIWSADKIATEIATALVGLLDYKGGYDASSNVPDLAAGTGILKGDAYTVTTAGDPFRSDTPLEVGDFLYANVDNPTTESDWTIVNKNIDLATVDVPGIVQLAPLNDATPGLVVQADDPRLLATGKTRLTADTTLYINATSGSDTSGAGLATGVDAYQTLPFALQDAVKLYDLAEFNLTFQLEDGTHVLSSGLVIPNFTNNRLLSPCTVSIRGNATNPENVIIDYTGGGFAAITLQQLPFKVCFSNFKLTMNAPNTGFVNVSFGAWLQLEGTIIYSATARFLYWALRGGRVSVTNSYTASFETSTLESYMIAARGHVDHANGTIEVAENNTLTINTAFIDGLNFSVFNFSGDPLKYVILGTVTGKKFAIRALSVIELAIPDSNDLNILPGDIDGSIKDGSAYGYNGNYINYVDTYSVGVNNIQPALDLLIRNQSINRESITADKTLVNTDVAFQHLILNADRNATLPVAPTKNLYFAFINSDTSLGNLTVVDAVLAPGDRYEIIFDGVEWVEL